MGDSSSTPPARSRRISMLPIRDTEPAQAHHRLQVLELENVGLTEELEHVERKNLELERQLDALRATIAQQPQSGLAESQEESVLASTSMSFDASPNYAAEVKGARRLIHRLATHISAHDPSASLRNPHPSTTRDTLPSTRAWSTIRNAPSSHRGDTSDDAEWEAHRRTRVPQRPTRRRGDSKECVGGAYTPDYLCCGRSPHARRTATSNDRTAPNRAAQRSGRSGIHLHTPAHTATASRTTTQRRARSKVDRCRVDARRACTAHTTTTFGTATKRRAGHRAGCGQSQDRISLCDRHLQRGDERPH